MRAVAPRLSFAQAASGLLGGAYTPFFGAWLAWKGLSPGEIGALMAAAMLLRVIVSPFTGIIADAHNDRRAMMLALYAVVFAGYAALNGAGAVTLIFLAAVPANIATGSITPLLESVSVRLADRFGFDYGHVRLWASTLFVIGNVASGVAVSLWGMIVIAPWLAVSAGLGLFAVYALPRPPARAPKSDLGLRMRATLAEARELLRSRVFVIFLLAASFDQGSHAFYYGYGGLHWRQIGYSGTLIGILWPLGVLAEIALMSMSLKVFRALGSTRLLLLGGLGCLLRWSILGLDPPLPFVVFAQFLHGATFALAHLGAMYFILKAVPPRLAATAQSLYAVGSSGIVMGLATLASGPLYAQFGGRTYFLMAAMGLMAAIFAFALGRSWGGERITAHAATDEIGDTI
ncbi:MAG: MFS transporter [Alphaproteobacteria bacterium]|nr:MFS transporter [Alphaproteobacteria bacterium]MDE2012848.1 MFS transporter [Alphaproteobacteria bacterium]MDE2074992.1 MFS transporter [Alphaproteobacteria bacterium]MDE2350544.1 MFS transporter [Alphaproteobacteria bacterium]